MIKYLLRAIALGVTAFAMLALVKMQSSQARMILLVTGYHTPIATPTGTPPGCTTIPGTNIQRGQVCFRQSSCPGEDAFSHDPFASGADPTGVNDSSGAISTAIGLGITQGGHGDVKFAHAGTYTVNLTTGGTYVNPDGINPPASSHIECTVPGVNLQMTTPASSNNVAIIKIANANVTVCGCNFVGGQTGPPPYLIGGNGNSASCQANAPSGAGCESSQGMALIRIVDSGATNALVEGNSFTKALGDAAVQLYQNANGPSSSGPSGATIKFNTYSANSYYCNNVDGGLGGTTTISNNLLIDCAEDVEWDACAGGNVGTVNVIQNELDSQVGNCFTEETCLGVTPGNSGCSGAGVQGVGYQGNGFTGVCTTSGVTFGGSVANANYCAGTAAVPASYGLKTAGSSGTVIMTNNIVGPNCTCTAGSGNC